MLDARFVNALATPKAMIDLLHSHKEEARIIEHFTIDADKVVKVAEPDDAKLKETYEQNKRQFVAPELRKINLLTLAREQKVDLRRISILQLAEQYLAFIAAARALVRLASASQAVGPTQSPARTRFGVPATSTPGRPGRPWWMAPYQRHLSAVPTPSSSRYNAAVMNWAPGSLIWPFKGLQRKTRNTPGAPSRMRNKSAGSTTTSSSPKSSWYELISASIFTSTNCGVSQIIAGHLVSWTAIGV